MVRALERLVPNHRLVRITVEIMRPIPMSGFRVQAEVRRPGRSVTLSEAEIFDEEQVLARAFGLHLRQLDLIDVPTAPATAPDFAASVPAGFPIHRATHDEEWIGASVSVRYDPAHSQGTGGPTWMWMRALVPILAGEEPTGFQRICPLADSGNGISYNAYLDQMLFLNADLTVSLHREPAGEWLLTKSVSHWQPDGTGVADAELFDRSGPVGRATQSLILNPA
jgi:hypothetical protein